MEQRTAEDVRSSQVGRIEYLGPGIEREVITTDKAPKAIGPYSQAIRVDATVFTSGQVALDPATGKLIEGDVTAQTRQVLTNLAAVLEAAGTSPAHVVKTTVFLANMDDFAAMNQVYAEFFGDKPPARSTVQVARLPLGALVEVEAVAIVG
jgi:2-iminobutanoate/2-iminopropanoate deaminase